MNYKSTRNNKKTVNSSYAVLHGLAGDLSLRKQSCESLIAGDIIESIGEAFNFIRS